MSGEKVAEIQNIIRNIEIAMLNEHVNQLKGACWKAAVELLIENYGIKDATIPMKVEESLRVALKQFGYSHEAAMATADALTEFKLEYKQIISD